MVRPWRVSTLPVAVGIGVIAGAILTSCTHQTPSPHQAGPSSAGTTTGPTTSEQAGATDAWARARPPASCPVTVSSSSVRPPAPIVVTSQPVAWSADWYGNAALWVRLPPTGVVPAQPDLSVKFPWWRTQPGRLTIDGELLGANGGELRATIPDGYGDIGFQVSGLDLSTTGCWRITGHLESASLSVVVWVQSFDDN